MLEEHCELRQFDQSGAAALVKRLALAEASGERWFDAETYRIAGEIELRSPECNSAHAQRHLSKRWASLVRNRLAPWNFRAATSSRGSGAIRGGTRKRAIDSLASTTGSQRASTRSI